LRRPLPEQSDANRTKAISYAGYRALVDLLQPSQTTVFDPLMATLGFDPNDTSTDVSTPQGIGNVACAAVLDFRHHDGSNQLGDLAPGAYSDYTGYQPVNAPSTVPVNPATISNPDHWQPLTYVDATNTLVTQVFAAPFWTLVKPFALTSGSEFRQLEAQYGPALYGSQTYRLQAQQLVDLSANLTDAQKMIAEYWALGPHSEQPPGHWDLVAQYVSARDHHTIDDDAKMFFIVTNAIFDAGIASWDAKRAWDSIRPVSAIPYLFNGQTIRSWGGPGKGTVEMDGSQWIPYQAATFPTPPFASFTSGHSTFSAAGAEVLKLFTGSDRYGDSVSFQPGTSKYDPGFAPKSVVTLKWPTFSDAADQAGISRRYGGIHFQSDDYAGRCVGRLVAMQAWRNAQFYFNGGSFHRSGEDRESRDHRESWFDTSAWAGQGQCPATWSGQPPDIHWWSERLR